MKKEKVMVVINFLLDLMIKLLRITALLLVIATFVIALLTIWYVIDFESYRFWADKLSSLISFISDYSKEMFLLLVGRFSSNVKNNLKGIFTAVVMLSTFAVNITRYRSLKREEKSEKNDKT